MKTTKATIYAKYGIEYKSGKINTPIGWMPVVEHSTDYVATEDPRYQELVDLVEHQEF